MIPEKESCTVEFKSDRKRLSDDELVETVVCLANSEGGEIYLGVENDGIVSGLHHAHQNISGLTAVIANKTIPPLTVRGEFLNINGKQVAKIIVPKSQRIVATSDGKLLRRRMMADGTPGCVPFYPHELYQREADLRLLDYSTLPVSGASSKDIDPLAREKLKQVTRRYQGDSNVLSLSDDELDQALGLVKREEGVLRPTVAGLLVIGREEALREYLPTHEVAFQVLEGTRVRVNEFYRTALIHIFERIMDHFNTRLEERELQVGLFRVPVPSFDRRSFREAFANAIIHRDYTKLGAVHVRWVPDAIEISNPGGFVEGVTLENLLVTEPRPRNPLLADVFKRLGLVERTGRGVDIIFEGMLRYGRPAPDYGRSTDETVTVHLPGGEADLKFFEIVIEQENKTSQPLPVDTLIALRALRDRRQLDTGELAKLIQKDEVSARQVLEHMIEAGLVEARGAARGRTYLLSSSIYRKLGEPAAYIRIRGFDRIQQEQMIKDYVRKHGNITRREAAELCRLNLNQASYLLRKLSESDLLLPVGKGRNAHYVLNKMSENSHS